jgi:DNA-binding NarL/FixJ family response regulator
LHDQDAIQLHEKLSDREFQILCRFGEGKTVKQIAEALSLSAPTVSTYRARILDKMDMRATAQPVSYAIQNGLAKPKKRSKALLTHDASGEGCFLDEPC